MHVKDAQIRIHDALEWHGTGVLELSGGKDSIAVMHMCLPWKDRVTIMFCDPGDSYPHVLGHIKQLCYMWGFELRIVTPELSVLDGKRIFGLPADVIPTWAHREAAQFLPERRKPKVVMRSGVECCAMHLWMPLHRAIEASGTTLVFRGSKGTDEHVTAEDGTIFQGIEYVSPLWRWTDEMVYEYCDRHNIMLPSQYRHGCNHSLDCVHCTAWGDTEAELQRMRFTKRFYPKEFSEWQDDMHAIKVETERYVAMVKPFFDMVE